MNKIILVFFVSLFSLTCHAQKRDLSKLNEYLEKLEEHDKFMGTLVLSHEGEVVYGKSVGYADKEAGIKSSLDTKYRIGSISKMFTSAMILMAEEEGKLNLEERLDRYFPKVDKAEDITISNLLNHRSGITNFTDDPSYLKWHTEYKSREDLLGIIESGKSEFSPDSKGKYSNSNYLLLTFILEDIYEKPYAEILEDKITGPLALQQTTVFSKINSANNESHSYKFVSDSWKKEAETDASIPLGAGALISTPNDLVKFIEALFAGELVSEESLGKMMEIKDNYGRGMFKFPFEDKSSYGHGGGIDGFTSMLSYFPEENLTLVLTSNGNNYNSNNIALAALSDFFGKPFDMPRFNQISLTSEDLEKYIGIYESEQLPLDITISTKNNRLFAQATGQQEFGMDAVDEHEFEFTPASLVMIFSVDENKMMLKQAGKEYTFVKK
ncbi:MAG TPA: serine hydrolase domain-containing protein [Anditalea sp.]|nr:serine hydrolase domain-containing protein [Anditalea sp.]